MRKGPTLDPLRAGLRPEAPSRPADGRSESMISNCCRSIRNVTRLRRSSAPCADIFKVAEPVERVNWTHGCPASRARVVPPLLLIGLLTVLPACGGTTTNIGGKGGAAATGAAGSGSGVAGAGGVAGASGIMVDAGVCTPPTIEVAGNELIFVDVEWCGSSLSCATCTWEFLSSDVGEVTTPTLVPCKLPELICPGPSTGNVDASVTSCTEPVNENETAVVRV